MRSLPTRLSLAVLAGLLASLVAPTALAGNQPPAGDGSVDVPTTVGSRPEPPVNPAPPTTSAVPPAPVEAPPPPPAPPAFEPLTAEPVDPGCTSVVHIGDSLTAAILPETADAYRRVGIDDVIVSAVGGRSFHYAIDGDSPGLAIGRFLRPQLNDPCWVFALGTNDVGNIAIGKGAGPEQIIDDVLAVVGRDPVLFVTVAVREPAVFPVWTEAGAAAWNAALTAALPSHPNMRVYDWNALVQPSWTTDGVHYTEAAGQQRARLVAEALASAF